MKKLWTLIKKLFFKWKASFSEFRKHPIQYTKAYFKDFKALSAKEKAIKIFWAAAFVYATIYAFWFVVGIIVLFVVGGALFGSGDVELRRAQHARHMVDEYGGKESDYL